MTWIKNVKLFYVYGLIILNGGHSNSYFDANIYERAITWSTSIDKVRVNTMNHLSRTDKWTNQRLTDEVAESILSKPQHKRRSLDTTSDTAPISA